MVFGDFSDAQTGGIFSPQSEASYDSGFSGGVMDHSAEFGGDNYNMNFINELNGK